MLLAKSGSVYDRSLVHPDRNNFAPRIGLAYNINPKTVFRGGYGFSYIHQNRVGSADLLGINYPQVVIATINQSNPLDPTFVINLKAAECVGISPPLELLRQADRVVR